MLQLDELRKRFKLKQYGDFDEFLAELNMLEQ
jgi:hypothetical protein